jgi:hypothetical protein
MPFAWHAAKTTLNKLNWLVGLHRVDFFRCVRSQSLFVGTNLNKGHAIFCS